MPKQDNSGTEVDRLSDMAAPIDSANAEDEFFAIAKSGEVFAGMGSSGNVVDKDALIGVPLMVRKVTFNSGRGEVSPGVRKDMATIEAIVAPQSVMDSLGIPLDKFTATEPRKKVRPGTVVIINDSGTGIYRQVVSQLHSETLVEVDSEKGAMTLRGNAGTSAFDQPRSEWLNGEEDASVGIPVKWWWEKGLTKSKPYPGPDGSLTHTYYIG